MKNIIWKIKSEILLIAKSPSLFEPNSKIYNIYFLSIIHSFCNHLSLLKVIIEPYTISFDVVLISIQLLCILFILEHWNFQKNTYPFSWESVHEGFYHRPNCFLPTIRSLPDKHLMIHSGPKNKDYCNSNALCFY